MNRYFRKITKVGRSGLAVFLPIAWTRGENLQPGDLLEVIEDTGILIIKPKAPPVNQK
jgi:bifunctional DNA-binding transcriptional regulator/antitoxin component of YhaV-PrlF toxin-antitoxin module